MGLVDNVFDLDVLAPNAVRFNRFGQRLRKLEVNRSNESSVRGTPNP